MRSNAYERAQDSAQRRWFRCALMCTNVLYRHCTQALALFVLGVCTIANPCWSIGYLTFGHICVCT